MKNASHIVSICPRDHLETMRRCGGFYQCPKDPDGARLGPLVGYAGKYTDKDGSQKQWVGDVYANFAKAEQFPHILHHFAQAIEEKMKKMLPLIDIFCGAPIGGYSFAQALGTVFDRRVIKAEKKVTALATAESREESVLVFGRHTIEIGDEVAIVEDVCNNFSTTDQLIELIIGAGGKVSVIVCLLNRSLRYEDWYGPWPIISLVRMEISEYRQDDPEVISDVAKGNVVWKPKNEWPRLMEAMEANKRK